MEYRILGPLEVYAGGQLLRLGSPQTARLPAALVLEANRVVSVSRLVDLVWGETPPTTVAVQVQGHVFRRRNRSSITPLGMLDRSAASSVEPASGRPAPVRANGTLAMLERVNGTFVQTRRQQR